MTRINLLPPEIAEKRKAESRWLYVAAIAIAIFAVLGLVWGFMFLQVQGKQGELASVTQEKSQREAEAAQLKVFTDQSEQLQKRQQIADQALAARVKWSSVFSEVSLVLPSDVWLETIEGTEKDGLTFTGWALDTSKAGIDYGFKAVAKTLVRLNEVQQLNDIWLESTTRGQASDTYRGKPSVRWAVKTQVSPEPTATTTPGQK